MTFYHIEVTHHLHDCPAQDEPHTWMTVRELVGVVDGGPCQNPEALFLAGQMAAIPCGRRLPTHLQCAACRPVIIERSVTTVHTGQVQP
jgi:hypothetical protein